nr:MAG TPA: centromere-binding protein [Caudoviricetes sp.]
MRGENRMEFDCTKEGKNIYFACREKAAKYNDLLNSRERAAELLGISTSTLANHELGVTKNVPPDTVVMMSDLYKTRNYAVIIANMNAR